MLVEAIAIRWWKDFAADSGCMQPWRTPCSAWPKVTLAKDHSIPSNFGAKMYFSDYVMSLDPLTYEVVGSLDGHQ